MIPPALLRGPFARAVLATVLPVLVCAASPALAAGERGAAPGDPLRAEQAFVPDLAADGRGTLTLSFAIEPGYYLYRDRLKLALVEPATGAALGAPDFPPAIVVEDEFFGESATYRDALAVPIPLETTPAVGAVALDVTWQGCADIGLCYPPTTTRLDVTLPVADPFVTGSSIVGPSGGSSPRDAIDALPRSTARPSSSAFPSSDAPAPGDAARSSSALSAGGSSAVSPSVGKTPAALSDLFGGAASGEPELLSPEEAYVPLVTHASPDRVEVLWRIEPGYYLYRDKTAFTLRVDGAGDGDGDELAIGAPVLDPGTLQHDEFFGDVAVWRTEALAVLPLERAVARGERATLEIAWQGCADIGVCFPPKTTRLPVTFDDAPDEASAGAVSDGVATGGGIPDVSPGGTARADVLAAEANGAAAPAPPPDIVARSATAASAAAVTSPDTGATASVAGAASTVPLQSEQGRLAALLGSRGLWINAVAFVGFGLLLAFTPCVLPMIPILSSLIVGRGDGMTTGRAFRLSLLYVLVMASAYAVLGVIVGLTGYNVQPLLQDPWVLSAVAALFVLLASSMFGLFELQLPLALQAKLTSWSNSQKGGETGGVVVMALLSTLIVGPCMTAPLMGALIYIADTGDAAIGGVALFSLGLGMGIPLLLVGLSAGTLLPRAGAWMVRVKQVFGVVLLGMAVYMLSRFLPANVTMGLAGALALASGVLFGATDTLDAGSSGRQRFAKGAGLVVAVYGLALLVGSFAGGGSYVTPLGALAARTGGGAGVAATEEHGLAFRTIKGPDGLAAAVAEASAAGRPLMLDFYADWCVSCKEMEAFTFTDPGVQAALGDALVVQADVTANDAADQALLEQFGLYGPPGIIFYDARGQELPGARVVGYVPAERFAEHVSRAIGGRTI